MLIKHTSRREKPNNYKSCGGLENLVNKAGRAVGIEIDSKSVALILGFINSSFQSTKKNEQSPAAASSHSIPSASSEHVNSNTDTKEQLCALPIANQVETLSFLPSLEPLDSIELTAEISPVVAASASQNTLGLVLHRKVTHRFIIYYGLVLHRKVTQGLIIYCVISSLTGRYRIIRSLMG